MITDELNKVEGYSYLRKDLSNGGVVNVDRKAYEQHMRSRAIAKRNMAEKQINQESINSMRTEIDSIKDDMAEIKTMLLSLMNRNQ